MDDVNGYVCHLVTHVRRVDVTSDKRCPCWRIVRMSMSAHGMEDTDGIGRIQERRGHDGLLGERASRRHILIHRWMNESC